MTSGASASNSAAYLRTLLASPAPQRYSIRTLRPSVQPNSCSPCSNAVLRCCDSGSAVARLMINAPHPLRLLCAHRERPRCCRASKHFDELAPSHLPSPQRLGTEDRTASNEQTGRGRRRRKPMSALGQKQTCAVHQPLSALPPIDGVIGRRCCG